MDLLRWAGSPQATFSLGFLPPVLTDSLATLVHSVTSGGYSTSRPHGRQHHRGCRQAPEGRPFEYPPVNQANKRSE